MNCESPVSEMNQAQKDRAWKIFEIAFAVSLGLFVLMDWKHFIAWLIRYVADILKAFVLLVVLGVAIELVRKIFSDHD